MQPQVEAFFHETTNTASYVVRDGRSNACAIVDSVLDYDAASGRTSPASAGLSTGPWQEFVSREAFLAACLGHALPGHSQRKSVLWRKFLRLLSPPLAFM
jgi:glyoxylase-like metal-dependent hydrolase (beta-lactamase superfamily II)